MTAEDAFTEPTVMFGVPVRPEAFVARVAVSALPVTSPVTSPTTSPVRLPLKVVAVATPVMTTPPGFACALIVPPLSFNEVASIPVKALPSP